ncbi:PAS domain-containing sensor histidine kinase [Desulfosoma caldarium]|uniref:histidine kinase n=1 Tax=Desulfosoma caldarium TaxID=610254 RepID=A0A3N1UM98_9BACT|nr:ATP-binding protein [Desulfosoma caldarium]ROQ89840.1 PAS domain S-box-containing protein [Desulfosoma caldarium]
MEFLERLKFKTTISVVSLTMIFSVALAAWLGIRMSILPAMEERVEDQLQALGENLHQWLEAAPRRTAPKELGTRLHEQIIFYPGFHALRLEDAQGTLLFASGSLQDDPSRQWEVRRRAKGMELTRSKGNGTPLYELVLTVAPPDAKTPLVVRLGVHDPLMKPMRERLLQTLLLTTALILIAGYFISRWFTARITHPVQRLLEMTQLLAQGRMHDVLKSVDVNPLCRPVSAAGTWDLEVPAPGMCPHLTQSGTEALFPWRKAEEKSAHQAPHPLCTECRVPDEVGDNELIRLLYSFHFMASEIRSYQDRLKNRYEFEERLLAACPDGIVANDASGRVILFNSGAERLLGYKVSEALFRMNVRDFYPQGETSAIKKALLSDDYGGPGVLVDYNVTVRTKDGRMLPVRLSATLLPEGGDTYSVVGFFHDLSELKAHMDALMQTNENLNAANRQLERLNRYYLEMLSFVTHELKSPIANGYMSANALRQEIFGPLRDEQKRMVEAICNNLNQSMEMIRHYLDLSRIEKDELPVRPRRVRLDQEIVAPVLSALEPSMQEKGLRVEVDVPPGLAWTLDPELFRGVMTNLLSNAVKYGEPQGRLLVNAAVTSTGWLRLKVWNSGPGLSEEEQGRLFRKFQRLPSARRSATRGTGLGLFITKTLVERHGGRIWVESAQGKGVAFVMDVPPGMGAHAESLSQGEGE